MGVFIRILGKEIPTFSQVFLRYIVAATIAFAFIRNTKTSLKMKNVRDFLLMLFIAFFGYSLSTIFFTYAILTTEIANVIFIFSTYIIFTPILGYMFLREKISKFTLVAIILSLFGLYILLNPTNITNSLGGICALTGAILNASYFIGSRKLRNYPAKTLLFYSAFLGMVSLGILSIVLEGNFYTHSPAINVFSLSLTSWLTVFLFGLDNFLAWLFLNKGLQNVKAGTASVILLIEPVIVTIIGIALYAEIPQITAIFGMLLISSGVILAGRGE